MDAALATLATLAGARLKARGLKLAAAESCTGGWIAMAITAVAGSSQWFERGFVTYSNEAKHEMLGVAQATLDAQGAGARRAPAKWRRAQSHTAGHRSQWR